VDHQTKGRLCAAALLPFQDPRPDWEGFAASIRGMQAAAAYWGVKLIAELSAETSFPRTLFEGAKGV